METAKGALEPFLGMGERSRRVSGTLLGLAVVSASFSAILIRYATDAEPLAIAFWRSAAGAAILAPFAGPRMRPSQPGHFLLPGVAGVFLAVHFGAWITSLQVTTVAASVLLVSMSPIFVATAAWLLFGERLKLLGWGGIALAVLGTVVVVGGDLGRSLLGDALALLGGVMGGGYVLAGRKARRDLGIFEYAAITYGTAGVLLGLACGVGGIPLWGFGARTWLAIGGVIAGPQLLGHTVINLVLKDLDATTVSVATMVEPVLATLLAFFLFSEVPSLWLYPGGAAILAGIYLVSGPGRAPAVVM
jgi:drug/metabolite transporter (DMT)-like permease